MRALFLLLLVSLALALPALAQNGFGLYYWHGPADDGGVGLRYVKMAPAYDFELNWGYRWPAPDQSIGTVRGLFTVPMFRWSRGSLGIGPAVTWYWVAEERPGLQQALFDPEHDTLLETLLAMAIYATLDAATSPFITAGKEGHGIKIRPSVALHHALTEGLYVDISHDFGNGSHDLFNGTNYAVEFTKDF